jgi:hypothetical protein
MDADGNGDEHLDAEDAPWSVRTQLPDCTPSIVLGIMARRERAGYSGFF